MGFSGMGGSIATDKKIKKIEKTIEDIAIDGDGLYTNATPTPKELGGVPLGQVFNNVPYREMFTNILYPYVAPVLNFTTNPSINIKEFGDNISSIELNCLINKKSNNVTKVEFYRNNVLINTIPYPNMNGGIEKYIDNIPVNNTTTYNAKVYDGKEATTSPSKTITFVYPTYIGSISLDIPAESDVEAMTKLIEVKTDRTKTFTFSNAYVCYAYPSSYGNLRSITDPNGFEMIGSFNKSTLNITGLNGSMVEYNVYTSATKSTLAGFNISFKF